MTTSDHTTDELGGGESMVERVARAIEEERWQIAKQITHGAVIGAKESSRRLARAALAALTPNP